MCVIFVDAEADRVHRAELPARRVPLLLLQPHLLESGELCAE